MPTWVKDEDIWQKAKAKVLKDKSKSQSELTDRDWGLVTHIYKNMGGKVGYLQIVKRIANEILGISILTVDQILRRSQVLKSAKTVLDLISDTSKKSIKYESGCSADLKRATPKIGRWLFSVKCTSKKSKGPYDVRFRILKGQKIKDPMQREIEVSCNCFAWRYNGADWNAKNKNYSERQFSDGSAPKIRDKKRKYLICKHVAACVPLFSGYIVPKEMRK